MREPSIHITESELSNILVKILGYTVPASNQYARDICRLASKKSLTNRQLVITNDKLLREAKKVNNARADHVMVFLKSVTYQRKKKERFVKFQSPKRGSPDFKAAKEAAQDALNFCDAFELELSKGMNIYVEIGLAKMQKFAYFKFAKMYESICRSYEARIEYDKINLHKASEKVKQEYISKVYEITGLPTEHNSEEDMLCFARVAKFCEVKKLPINLYLQSQFDEFSYRNTYPAPAQLWGDKAVVRFTKFLKNKGLKVKK